eukprot:4339412-Pyramimonas_sp.AAC.1
MERPTQRVAGRAARPRHEMCWPRMRWGAAYAAQSPAAPGSIPSYAALCRGQGLPTSGPKRPSAP